MSLSPLCVVPTYLSEASDVDLVETMLRTLRGTAGAEVDVLLVDDGSPNQAAVEAVEALKSRWDFEYYLKGENTGFSTTVNIGLKQALLEVRDVILVNADIEFRHPGWVRAFQEQPNLFHDGPAWVVGALLSFPTGIVQHAGIYFSLLTRSFDHIFKFAPETLEEVLAYRCCPVTGALQYIRHEALVAVGLYDERYRMGWEDVQYCLRVFDQGQECVFHPGIRAYHHESVFRGRKSKKVERWTQESLKCLMDDIEGLNFAMMVPQW